MSQDIMQKVLDSPRLPSLPAIALQVIELVQSPDASMKAIANVIQQDPALAGKILKTVNSSFYSLPKRVTTISAALVVLGLNSVKTLALGFSLVSNVKATSASGFDHNAYWRRSALASAASRRLAELSGNLEAEEAFLGALLQDLGQLALAAALGDKYGKVCGNAQHRDLSRIETEALGLNHSDVGARLAMRWKLPDVLTDCIQFHDAPNRCESEHRNMVRCVTLGAQFADLIDPDQPTDHHQMEKLTRRAQEWLGIDPTQIDPLIKSIVETTREVQQLLDLPADADDTDRILAQANEAREELTLMTARQAQTLVHENEELAIRANRDDLTGAATRKVFGEFMIKHFAATSQDGGPLSVLFSDTDHFKRFNDNYGHQIGDAVLVAQTQLMQELCPPNGLVARYGGEEFAIALPDTSRRDATAFAEQLRRAIEAMSDVTDDEGNVLRITNSIGVATYDGSIFTNPAQLIKSADQAVYAAKASGRNCVRVFAPRQAAA